jgi:hypothetical protein
MLDDQQRKWASEFIQKHYKYEFGVWINAKDRGEKYMEQMVKEVFSVSEINTNTGKIIVEKIKKVMPEKKQ